MYEDSPYVGVYHSRSFCESYPDVRAYCAHMGSYETNAFLELLRDHETAFLDTCFHNINCCPAVRGVRT